MAVPYKWRCKVCEQTNIAHSSVCAHCGSRAVAAPIEVYAEIAERSGVPLSKVEQDEYDFFESTRGMPWWKKCIVHSLQAIIVISAIAVKGMIFSINFLIAIFVMIVSGLALAVLSNKAPTEHSPNAPLPEKQ